MSLYRLGKENVCGVCVVCVCVCVSGEGRGGGKQEGYVFCCDVNIICIMDFV